LDAERFEEAGGDAGARQHFDLRTGGDVERDGLVERDRGERVAQPAPIEIIRGRDGDAHGAFADALFPNGDDLLRTVVRQRPEQHGVEDAEHAVLAPMPRAIVATAATVNAGLRRSARAA